MGRSKPLPKRRRVEEEQAEKAAIERLRTMPQDTVEAAAADAVRADLATWHHLSSDGDVGLPFSGLGRFTMDEPDFAIFRRLHDAIQQQASSSMASWSGSISDPRRRAFGFLPDTLGYDEKVRSSLDISQPDATKTAAALERPRNAKAMVILPSEGNELLLGEVKGAMERLLSKFRPQVQQPELQRYLQYSQLVAAQPNLHNGRHLLPSHVDHPTKDGFGILIITIAIRGAATIMLEAASPTESSSRATFVLPERGVYMLSGPVRNACLHGVLADEGSDHRESLNLRFGLHGLVDGKDPPPSDVLQHWSGLGKELT